MSGEGNDAPAARSRHLETPRQPIPASPQAKRGGPPALSRGGPPREGRPAAPCSPAGGPRSTLGDGALHFRVRDGNGCCLPSSGPPA